MSHWCWSRGHDSFGTWLISEILSPWLVERDFNRTEWATAQASFYFWCGKLNIFLNKSKSSPRDVHQSRSQCLIPQGAVPSWLPPGAILFPLAARNSQQVYQDGVKHQCSCSSYLKTFNLIAEYTHKNLSSTGWWITAAFLGVKRLRDIGFRKEGRQTKGTHAHLSYSWDSKYPCSWFFTNASTNTSEKLICYSLLQAYKDYKGNRHPVQVNKQLPD